MTILIPSSDMMARNRAVAQRREEVACCGVEVRVLRTAVGSRPLARSCGRFHHEDHVAVGMNQLASKRAIKPFRLHISSRQECRA